MGSVSSKFAGWEKVPHAVVPKIHIGIFGLRGSGKTTILHQIQSFQTLNPHVEIDASEYGIVYSRLRLSEITKQEDYNMWMSYKNNLDVIVYVVDSGDLSQIFRLITDFQKVYTYPWFEESFFLILANKQDEKVSLKADDIVSILDLNNIPQKWVVQECVAINDQSLTGLTTKLLEMLNIRPNENAFK